MTKVIYSDGQTETERGGYDQRQMEYVKAALARAYAVDLPAQAKLLRAKYHLRRVMHFYLPDGRVFVPFKLRESRISGDACYGYIELDQVARLLPSDKPAVILRFGTQLPIFTTISIARLAYFTGLEILSDFFKPQEDTDLDLVNALTMLRGVLTGQPSPYAQSSGRFKAKFLPNNRLFPA